MVEIVAGWLVFVILIGGLGLPLVATTRFRADERLCLGAAVGGTTVYLAAWSVYWLGLPARAFLALPFFAAGAFLVGRRSVGEVFRDLAARKLAALWMIIGGWCLGLLALIRNYSGGEWIGDWFEHYHRTLFFLQRLPLDTQFLNMYSLPARPPLANLVVGAELALTRQSFAYFQVYLALFSTLVFFPAALLARRFRGPSCGDPAGAIAVLLMLSPLFVENVTFSWTKLPAAFFVLTGVYFFPGSNRRTGSFSSVFPTVLCLAAALLTHYSAAPYLLAIGAYWLWQERHRWNEAQFRRDSLSSWAFGLALLATWVTWSTWHFGRSTYAATTVVTDQEGLTGTEQVMRRFVNLFNLIVPHPLRPAEYIHVMQASRAGAWRDYFFDLYQTNLLFAFGSGGMVILALLLWRHRRRAAGFWGYFATTILLLNAAVISWTDRWGSVHIGLQPLVLIGLAWIAAGLPQLGRWTKRWLICGLAIDALLGIALQFFLEHVNLAEVYANQSDETRIALRGYPTWSNFFTKSAQHLAFLGDGGIPILPLCLMLALLLALAVSMASRTNNNSKPSPC